METRCKGAGWERKWQERLLFLYPGEMKLVGTALSKMTQQRFAFIRTISAAESCVQPRLRWTPRGPRFPRSGEAPPPAELGPRRTNTEHHVLAEQSLWFWGTDDDEGRLGSVQDLQGECCARSASGTPVPSAWNSVYRDAPLMSRSGRHMAGHGVPHPQRPCFGSSTAMHSGRVKPLFCQTRKHCALCWMSLGAHRLHMRSVGSDVIVRSAPT